MNKGRAVFKIAVLFLSFAGCGKSSESVFVATIHDKNPWTHLKFENRSENFQFAIVGDRAGGTRFGVFKKAIHKGL